MAIPKIQSYSLPEISEYPNNKVNWSLQPANAALLIHDMQEYFVGFYGNESPLMNAVIQNISRLKDYAKANGIPVFYRVARKTSSFRARMNSATAKPF